MPERLMLPFRWYKSAFPVWLRALLFVLVAPGAVAVLVPYLILARDWEWQRLELRAARLVGLPLMLVGGLAYLSCLRDFVARGRGTPSPLDPPETLVTGGLYRFVRNPMYVTVGFLLIGEILFFESLALLILLLVLWSGFHLWVVYYEEPTLARTFGSAYGEYRRNVPRWVPRFGRANRETGLHSTPARSKDEHGRRHSGSDAGP